MAEYVQWGSVPQGGGEKSDYLRLESGRTYRIRPVFDPVRFHKYFHKHDGRLRTAVCGDPSTCPVRDRHPELKKPSMRYAAYVIDRADGLVKILEAPQSVFRPIGSSFEATGKNPGSGKDGSDWQVKVSGKGLNTTYEVAFVSTTPLSGEERASIKEALDGDVKKLQKLYKVDTPAEIEEKLFGDLNKQGSEIKSSSQEGDFGFEQSPVTPATPAIVAVDDGDDFENNF